jgi:Holliday junction resolvase RusA-like endonuclease
MRIVPFERPRFNRFTKAVFNSSRYNRFRTELQTVLVNAWGKPQVLTKKPIQLHLSFNFKLPKKPKSLLPVGVPDLDNCVKSLMDCGNGVLWEDDAQVVKLTAQKTYLDHNGIYIEYLEIE